MRGLPIPCAALRVDEWTATHAPGTGRTSPAFSRSRRRLLEGRGGTGRMRWRSSVAAAGMVVSGASEAAVLCTAKPARRPSGAHRPSRPRSLESPAARRIA
jgi:hypothetical protein